MSEKISNTEDIIDIRDVIARLEELEEAFNSAMENVPDNERGNPDNQAWKEWEESEEAEELKVLQSLMDNLKGNGGDEQWRGDWYPLTLIHENYFEDYTEELVTDCGYISRDFPLWIMIDWNEKAENVKVDYFNVDFDGETYWTR